MNAIQFHNQSILGIGLMSGTSMDGLDIACVSFDRENPKHWVLRDTEYIPYPEQMCDLVADAHTVDVSTFYQRHITLGKWFGEQVNRFITARSLEVDFISSHGQTILHKPDENFTIQMGHGAYISAATGITVISDLRSMDMAYQGQGAPMVPIGEQGLFPAYKVFLNIGGIANISFHKKNEVIGFDICGANNVLNYLCKDIQQSFDESGHIARSGKVYPELMDSLNQMTFYQQDIPRSLDKSENLSQLIEIFAKFGQLSTRDLLCTYTEHIAEQISLALQKGNISQDSSVLITGGGTHNRFLIECIEKNTSATLIQPDQQVIDFKESIIMAYCGYLRLQQKRNFLKEVTGAKIDSISGAVYSGNRIRI